MIKIEELKRSCGCSTCDNDAVKKLEFKDPFSNGSTSVNLCDQCLEKLRMTIK